MKPSEMSTKIAETLPFKDAVLLGKIRLYANDPLGCTKIRVLYSGWNRRLTWEAHEGTHTQSTKCHWSGQELHDRIGKVDIDVVDKSVHVDKERP